MSDLHEKRIEAAAKALWELHAKLDDPLWESGELDYGIKQIYRKDARAALVAAQGAEPQAEAYDHCCQHPKCPGGSLCCCASEQRLRDCWNQWREEIAGDSRQAFRDGYQAGQNDPAPWLAAPVLPSSGVDEDKLAEVIAKSRGFGNGWAQIPPLTREAYREIARAVAAWLKGRDDDTDAY